MTPRHTLASLGLLATLAGPAAAQGTGGPGYSMVFKGVEFSACVEFLMEPEMAAEQLGAGYLAIPAVNFTPLSDILRREIQGESGNSAWIPAQVCVVEAPSVSAGGRILTTEKKMGPREVVGLWLIAATRAEGTTSRDEWFVAQLWTNDWHVEKATESAFIPMATFDASLDPVPESNRHSYELKIGKTYLSWDGELVGRDSTDTQRSVEAKLILTGKRSIQWSGQLSMQTSWMRFLPGTFRVQGKDDLAKALKASPIRMFGPMYWSGDARLDFTR